MEGPCSVYSSGKVSKWSVPSVPFPYQAPSMKPGHPKVGETFYCMTPEIIISYGEGSLSLSGDTNP